MSGPLTFNNKPSKYTGKVANYASFVPLKRLCCYEVPLWWHCWAWESKCRIFECWRRHNVHDKCQNEALLLAECIAIIYQAKRRIGWYRCIRGVAFWRDPGITVHEFYCCCWQLMMVMMTSLFLILSIFCSSAWAHAQRQGWCACFILSRVA